ncbi:Y-family DNA polymerase [Bacteroides thetaiotaomicron]|jgi:umuC protein|uniref:Y-family DNA polymerase n=1 Tax=Bacteroides thetaiotaomicron TaxID=818 RepID=UPI00101C7E62|nr:Y-family DNA polymerase [Bacteroides thetaiotaomicron]
MIALVDGNNFFVSCERVFNPYWNNRPLLVLSNNDGCVIARSNEVKKLGIKMGTPAFQIIDLIKEYGIGVYSGNQNLYGDMSCRVMSLLSNYSPDIEVYSVDESFLDLSGYGNIDLKEYTRSMIRTVTKGTGIPVSAGVANTKTLAKVANKFAKKFPGYEGVCIIDNDEKREKALKLTSVGDVWGIGSRYQKKLERYNVNTAYEFSQMPVAWVRKEMTVFGERVWKELNGEPCLDLDQVAPRKKQICTSRSFGTTIFEYSDMEEAVSTFAGMCALKLRRQHSCAFTLMVFVGCMNDARPGTHIYLNSVVKLMVPSNNTMEIVRHALLALKAIYRKGVGYKKAGVIVMDLVPDAAIQQNLFYTEDREKLSMLMNVIDELNNGLVKNRVGLAVQGTGTRKWKLKQERLSPCYTTQLSDVLSINCK